MMWDKFNADEVDHNFVKKIEEAGYSIISASGVDISDEDTVKSHIVEEIAKYDSKESNELNKIIAVHIFKPEEFEEIDTISMSLQTLSNSFIGVYLDLRKGSKEIQRYINDNFEESGDKTLRGGRERVTLDSLVKVEDISVGIEYETSTNIDNGYFTLKEAIKIGRAKYGVMVVPWSASHSGRANEAKGIGRLDRGCNDAESPIGPIFCVSLVRILDIYRHLNNA